jgi:hypothetical protein
MPDAITALAAEQKAFVEQFLRTASSKTLLVAATGMGKTTTSMYLAKRLLDQGLVDSTFVIADHLALREQWRQVAGRVEISLQSSKEGIEAGASGIVIGSQTLRYLNRRDEIKRALGQKRWFLLADEPSAENPKVNAFVDEVLRENRGSRALFLSRHFPLLGSFDSAYQFNSVSIFDRRIIELPETEIRIAQYAPSFSVLRDLQRNAARLDGLSWRQFEKLIAELLERDGYEVQLMQGSKDGGVDVVAVKKLGAAGFFKTLWQAKKKGLKSRVGIEVVRELADTRQEFGASKAFIVTSTYLTKGALQRIDRDRFVLGKVDRDDLDSWIKKTLYGQQE